ncbi:MAG: histidine kinase [Flavobacteriaceae bacterium]|nr:histidine kinase [Flavobacteriaceae bacterium]|tara:strand:+ start:1048 stop:2145 length:1098 start_codon:yes stop_codon:yes gene_type:complete
MPKNFKKVEDILYGKIFNHAKGGISIVSLNGEWVKVNQSLVKLLGYSEEEFYSMTFQNITHKDDLEKDVNLMHQLLNGYMESYQIEKRYFHKDGHIVWALLSVSLVKDAQEKPMYFISQIADISEQKSASWRFQFLMNIVKGQNETLKDFTYIATHDIRTYVGNLFSISEFLEEENPNLSYSENFKMLKESISNLHDTIEHLRQIKIDKPKHEHNLSSLKLNDYINRATYNVNAIAKKENCSILNNVDRNVMVMATEAYLDSIILNFLTNAIKYKSPKRLPVIEISSEIKDQFIILKIKDNGVGMDLSKNGSRLFTLNGTFNNHHDSRGIGLFITKNHIESLGGKIEVESTLDKGTCFSLYFIRA